MANGLEPITNLPVMLKCGCGKTPIVQFGMNQKTKVYECNVHCLNCHVSSVAANELMAREGWNYMFNYKEEESEDGSR